MTITELMAAQKNYNNLHNEGGEGYNPYDEMLNKAVIEQARKPMWTKEQTIANRQAWNTEVKKLISAHNGGQVPAKEVNALEAKVGYRLVTLKAEVAKWGIK